MESLTGINHPKYFLNLSLHHRPSFTKPISSISFKTPSRTTKSILRASSSSSSSSFSVPPSPNPETHNKNPLLETPKPVSFLIKTSCVAIFTAALFLARFNQPSIAATIVKPTVQSVETTKDEKPMKTLDGLSHDIAELKERIDASVKGKMFENLDELSHDMAELKERIDANVKAKMFEEAVFFIDQMLKIDPSAVIWSLVRAHLLGYRGEFDLAKLGYEEILEKDPVFIEAYQGLLMLATRASGTCTLEGVVKRIESAIKICKKNEDVRLLKLLLADICWGIEEKYTDALKMYQELVKEEPNDFRPYVSQGIIYTKLKNKGEANIQFEKCRKLVPKEHPYAPYFKQNMVATEVFTQIAKENN